MTTAAFIPTLDDLWCEARLWLAETAREFRGPVEIARTLARAARRAIGRRLRALEAFLMKLLLIEAADAPLDPPSIRRAAALAPGAPVCHAPEDPDDPETWRVRFCFRIPAAPRRGHAGAAGALPPRAPAVDATTVQGRAEASARKLARRFEALRRVAANPARAIAALARRLHALGAGACAVARRIALSPAAHGHRGLVVAHATVYAHDVCARFADTG
jgi:hypothetical protein